MLFNHRFSSVPLFDVFDADGNEIEHCIECDTETGRALRYRHIENGLVMRNESGDVVLDLVYRKAPLVVKPVSYETGGRSN